ncbi:neuronal acetylcholine receptor subunit alpha-10-like [Glandiceps talaboti]
MCTRNSFVGIFLCLLGHVTSSEQGARLVDDLLDIYPKYHVRPVRNESKPITVRHRLTPIQMLDIDEKNQIITIKCWLGQTWHDDYLQWDPEIYGDILQIHIPISEIWQPDIVLFGNVDEKFGRHFDTDAIVNYDGEVTALQPFVFTATCGIDVSYFPFDEQQCQLKFASWSYDGRFIDMVIDNSSNTERFVMNGEWDLVHMPIERHMEKYVCCEDEFPDITYTIHVRRRSMYYIFNIIFPSFLACILVAVGFYLPSDSGERVTLCVTSILAQFVFLTIVTEFMPPNSEFIPKLQIYFFILIGLVIFSAVVTACTLHMHFQGPNCHAVPNWLRNFTFNYLRKITCVRIRKVTSPSDSVKPTTINSQGDVQNAYLELQPVQKERSESNNGKCVGSNECPQIYKCSNKEDENQTQSKRLQEWRDVAKIIDRAYLILYLITLTATLVGFLIALYFGADSTNSKKS